MIRAYLNESAYGPKDFDHLVDIFVCNVKVDNNPARVGPNVKDINSRGTQSLHYLGSWNMGIEVDHVRLNRREVDRETIYAVDC